MEKVKMSLEGVDGNAFVILGTFRRQARRQGWTEEEINKVLDDARSGDYGHLLNVIGDNIED